MKFNKIKKSMKKLGVIITIFIFSIVRITLIINYTLNNVFISKYFSNIENEDVISKTEQSNKILQAKIKELGTTVQDYAIWDDTYDKVQEESIDETWFKENFTEWLPEKYGADLVVIVNRNRKIIDRHGLNNVNNILNDNKILQLLNEDKYNKETTVSGFKEYDGQIYMVSACPILKTNYEGSCQGIVIVGKKVSPVLLQNIKQEFGSDIFINYENNFVSSEEISKDINENIAIINKNTTNPIYKLNNSKIIGSLPITDISGTNIGSINVMQSREIFLSTQKMTQRNTLIAMFLSFIVIIILGFRLRNIIVKPIKNLENQIKKMEHENLLMKIDVNPNGPNEVIHLAESFNHMIDSINEHKKENQELKIYANTDYLTSVYNHKYYF
jgi:sensor domain CHASE-containing protein